MRRLLFLFCLMSVCCLMVWAQDEASLPVKEDNLVMPGIVLRPGVTADINAKVYQNTSSACQSSLGSTVLAIHDWTHTASTWQKFANAIMDNNQTLAFDGATVTGNVCRVVALDLPGHGRSGFPQGTALFGELLLEDYVSSIFGSLDRLRSIQIRPSIVIGHGAGGLLVQMMQQAKISKGTSLRREYGIRSVILLASGMPQGLSWQLFDNTGSVDLGMIPAIGSDPKFGTFLLFPDPMWIGLFFTGINGITHPNAPSSEEIRAQGYKAPEPLAIALQLANFSPLRRPAVNGGIFAPRYGTLLQVVAYDNDPVVRPIENQALYEYLTYGGAAKKFAVVKGLGGVHDMHIINPDILLWSIAGIVDIPFAIAEDIEPDFEP